MSQASRFHALRFERWREQAARSVSLACWPVDAGRPDVRRAVDALLSGEWGFDVHVAREWAQIELRVCAKAVQRCEDAKNWTPKSTGWPDQIMCNPTWLVPTWASSLAGRRRVAKRLLDTLDGRCQWAPSAPRQPSECRACGGRSWSEVRRSAVDATKIDYTPCSYCHGTGHNLRGYLPPVEWPTSLVRWAEDGQRAAFDEGTGDPRPGGMYTQPDPLQSQILDDATEQGWRLQLHERTRVTTRGTHRDHDMALSYADLAQSYRSAARGSVERVRAFDALISAKGCWGRVSNWPKWARGELRHAEQRRGRERWREYDERAVALGEEAWRLLTDWMDLRAQPRVKIPATQRSVEDAQAYIEAHHSQPDAIEVNLNLHTCELMIRVRSEVVEYGTPLIQVIEQ